MHLEIQKQGKTRKFYLAHAFREDGKVKKIRRYLGADLTEQKLKELRARAEELFSEQIRAYLGIKDPLKTAISSKELQLIKRLQAKGQIKIGHLSEKDWEKFTELFTYNTNAIEGSTISFTEVEGIIQKNKWPNKPKEEISETYGVAEAIKYIRETKEHISVPLILELHRIVFKNSKPFAGRFREKGTEVVIQDRFGNIAHRGAPSRMVKGLLNELIKWYEQNKKKYPPLLLSAIVHNQFENIHPFQDGNGRVGRLLLNNILLKNKMPPLNIGLENRQAYYSAIQAYQNHGNIRPMIEFMIKEYRNLKKKMKDNTV